MYAGVVESKVVAWSFADGFEEIRANFPTVEFVEMTLENSPATIGDKWDGVKFYAEGEING